MRRFSIEEKLKTILIRLFKKDKVAYEAIMKKMDEIISCADVNHYKNLRYPLNDCKRVHIKGSFVLTFNYVESNDEIIFYDFDHHDNIYKKKIN